MKPFYTRSTVSQQCLFRITDIFCRNKSRLIERSSFKWKISFWIRSQLEPIFFAKSKSVRPALCFANFKNIKTAQMNHCFLRACKIYCQIEIYWICFTSELRNLWVLFLTSDLLENWTPVNGWFYEITAVCLNVCLPVCQLRVFLDNHSLVLFSVFFLMMVDNCKI